jgi:hypothetical protein
VVELSGEETTVIEKDIARLEMRLDGRRVSQLRCDLVACALTFVHTLLDILDAGRERLRWLTIGNRIHQSDNVLCEEIDLCFDLFELRPRRRVVLIDMTVVLGDERVELRWGP